MDSQVVQAWIPRISVACAGIYGGIAFLKYAIEAGRSPKSRDACESADPDQARIQRADGERERKPALVRYAVAAVAFGTAIAVLFQLLSPVVGYAMYCLAIAARCVADQIAEEREPRRRSAVIGRSRRIDPVLLVWIAMTALSSLALVPWFFDETYRISAAIVALCVLAMLGIAWRVMTAPPILFGNDIEAEQVVDRETRTLRTGNACLIAMAAIFVFQAFVGTRRYEGLIILPVFLGMMVWKTIYARRVSRTPLTS